MFESKAEKIGFTDRAELEGVVREEWHGGAFTMVRYQYHPGTVFPEHAHDADQITVGLSGMIVFMVGGEDFPVGPGESFYIHGGVLHSARVPADGDGALSLNIFTPPRKEHP